MGLNRTPMSKVMAIWFGLEIMWSIPSVSIYIMCLNRTSEWNIMTIWISWEHSLFNFQRLDTSWASIVHLCQKLWPFELDPSILIYYVPESDIWGKSYDHLNFLTSSIFQFWASRYIMRLNRTPESKVMAIWIGSELSCSISSVSIYYVPNSDIRVKTYDHLIFLRTSVVLFQAFRYIMGLNRTHMSKVIDVWIFREHSCSIWSVSIYYEPESDIRVKSYDHLNF